VLRGTFLGVFVRNRGKIHQYFETPGIIQNIPRNIAGIFGQQSAMLE
jgi:hypothetical protein